MPNFIENANMPSERFVSALSRYRSSTVVYYNIKAQRKLTFNTYKKTIQNTPNNNDLYMVVSSNMEYRPDLVSQNIYGTPDFWWKILEANNIKDVYDFKIGVNLRLPVNIY